MWTMEDIWHDEQSSRNTATFADSSDCEPIWLEDSGASGQDDGPDSDSSEVLESTIMSVTQPFCPAGMPPLPALSKPAIENG
jgi:hypothetical protein